MNNDSKTTLFGFIKSVLIAGLAGFSYFAGADTVDLMTQTQGVGDWGALILLLISIFTFLKGFYTNKQGKV